MSAMLVYQKGSYHPKTTSFGDDRGHPSCRSCWEPHLFSRRKRADGTFWHSTELHLRGQQWTRFLQEDCHRIDLYGNIYGKIWKYIWNFCYIFLHFTEFRVSIHDIHVLDLSCTFPQFSFVLRLCGLRKPMSFIGPLEVAFKVEPSNSASSSSKAAWPSADLQEFFCSPWSELPKIFGIERYK